MSRRQSVPGTRGHGVKQGRGCVFIEYIPLAPSAMNMRTKIVSADWVRQAAVIGAHSLLARKESHQRGTVAPAQYPLLSAGQWAVSACPLTTDIFCVAAVFALRILPQNKCFVSREILCVDT